MAASDAMHDFVHRIAFYLNNCPPEKYKAHITPWNFFQWEIMSYDRAESLSLLKVVLRPPIDFVVVQLGENVADATTFESDLRELILFIRSRVLPKKILVLGNFWSNDALDMSKQRVCKTTRTCFLSLKDLQISTCTVGLHALVKGNDGTSHEILRAGVARHPGDFAMDAIAQRIVHALYHTV